MPTSSSPACGPGTEAMRNNGRAARFLQTWREDYIYQTLMSAAVSFGCTVLFALYNGYLGLRYGSIWHGSIGIFYLLLMAIRGIVLLTERRNQARPETEQNRCRRHTFLISSVLLLVLDLALILPISMMVVLHGTDPVHRHGDLYHLEDHHGLHSYCPAAAQVQRQHSGGGAANGQFHRRTGGDPDAAKYFDYGESDNDG